MRMAALLLSWLRLISELMTQIQKAASSSRSDLEGRKGTISQYFTTLHCPVCDDLTQHGICSKCRSQPQHVTVILNQEIRELERKQEQLLKVRPDSVDLGSQAVWDFQGIRYERTLV